MLQNILTTIPNYAKDIKLNFSSLLNNNSTLTKQQFWGTLVATAMVCKNKKLIHEILEEAANHLSFDAINAAKSAAAIMGMNNIYYRFIHLVSNTEYTKLSPNLRMSVMAQPGIDKIDFELFSLAVSAINGCGMCIDSHEKNLSAHKVEKIMIQEAIRIASIIHSTAMIMEAELA